MALKRGSWGRAVRPDWRGAVETSALISVALGSLWNVLSRAWTLAEGGLEATGIDQ